ncbi:MAG: GerMN domain-containing protein [Bacilli bacterium]|nr:GerMN domain-containing protein [Bacilli bacterium]
MLKNFSLRKIGLTSAALLAILLLYLLPSNDEKLKPEEKLEYVSSDLNMSDIFLLDKNSYVSLTKVVLTETQIENKARELLNILIIGNSDKVPNGFKAVIPPETKILSLKYDKGLIKVDFSEELLDVNEAQEEKMIEAIVYTLTSIDDVNKVIIYVNGEILTKLPKTRENLPSTLDRTFGINKKYDFYKVSNITDVTIYYVNKYHGSTYYVPVTKYLNDNRDKITIIVDELGVNFDYNTNLMSYLNEGVQLVSSSINNKTMSLEFNDYIFDDITTEKVLEEVIYTISMSAKENYDIDEVVLKNHTKEICKINIKKSTCKN